MYVVHAYKAHWSGSVGNAELWCVYVYIIIAFRDLSEVIYFN